MLGTGVDQAVTTHLESYEQIRKGNQDDGLSHHNEYIQLCYDILAAIVLRFLQQKYTPFMHDLHRIRATAN